MSEVVPFPSFMVRGSMCDIRPCGNGWVRFVHISDVVRIWANVSVVDPGVSRFTNAQPSGFSEASLRLLKTEPASEKGNLSAMS